MFATVVDLPSSGIAEVNSMVRGLSPPASKRYTGHRLCLLSDESWSRTAVRSRCA